MTNWPFTVMAAPLRSAAWPAACNSQALNSAVNARSG